MANGRSGSQAPDKNSNDDNNNNDDEMMMIMMMMKITITIQYSIRQKEK